MFSDKKSRALPVSLPRLSLPRLVGCREQAPRRHCCGGHAPRPDAPSGLGGRYVPIIWSDKAIILGFITGALGHNKETLARGAEHALIHGQDRCASPRGAQLWCQHRIGEFSSLHTLGPPSLRRQARRNSESYVAQGGYAIVIAWGQPLRPCTAKEHFATSVEAQKPHPVGPPTPLASAWHGWPRPTLQLFIFEASPQRKAMTQPASTGGGTLPRKDSHKSWW